VDIGVLTVVTAVLVALALRAWYRAYNRRTLAGAGSSRFTWPAVLTVAVLVAGGFEVGHHVRQDLATEALRAVTDVDGAHADCARFSDELFNVSQYQGYVYYDGSNAAHLRRDVCIDLWTYAHGGQRNPSDSEIFAVHVVTHEAMHINGIRSEAQAECTAMQLSHLVAEALGASPEQARRLQAKYFEEYYPHQRSDYRSGACTEGGAMDIDPERTEFP
jgi:hypothetical protein